MQDIEQRIATAHRAQFHFDTRIARDFNGRAILYWFEYRIYRRQSDKGQQVRQHSTLQPHVQRTIASQRRWQIHLQQPWF